MSWDLLNIDNAPRTPVYPSITPWDAAVAERANHVAVPFPPPNREVDYWHLDPWQRQALMRQFGRPRLPRTNKAGMADLLAAAQGAHDCRCGGSCGPCGGGLGFLQPTNDDQGGGDPFAWDPFAGWDFSGWFSDFGNIDPFAGGGGGGGIMFGPDTCGRPPNHPDYGCDCGTLFDDFSQECINPCPPGQWVGWVEKRDAVGNTTYETTCETDPNSVALVIPKCPAGTVDIGGGQCRSTATGAVTSQPRPGATGGTAAPPRASRSAPPTASQNVSAAQALAAAQAFCARNGKVYDPARRQCVARGSVVANQNPLGVVQSTVAGIPVWVWFLVGGFVLIQAVKR